MWTMLLVHPGPQFPWATSGFEPTRRGAERELSRAHVRVPGLVQNRGAEGEGACHPDGPLHRIWKRVRPPGFIDPCVPALVDFVPAGRGGCTS